jgi:hypothetical protein
VAIVHDGLPFVLPVTFRLGDERIVIHTVNEDDVVPLTRDRMVVFEADAFSAAGGWSVNVIGFANATDPRPARLRGRRSNGFADDEPKGVEIPFDMVVGQLIVPVAVDIALSAGSPFRVIDPAKPPSIAS